MGLQFKLGLTVGSGVRVKATSFVMVRVNVSGGKAFCEIRNFAIRLWVFVRATLESLV